MKENDEEQVEREKDILQNTHVQVCEMCDLNYKLNLLEIDTKIVHRS